jgi:hypothetical protein
MAIKLYKSNAFALLAWAFFTSIFVSVSVLSQDLNTIEVNIVKNISVDGDSKRNKENIFRNDFEIFYDSLVTRDQDGFRMLSKSEAEQRANTAKKDFLSLANDEYLVLKGSDQKEKLFNGSIIVEFKVVPNLNQYAQLNGLVFQSDLSDIKSGVFRVNNMYELKRIIAGLRLDDNVEDIELNTIDPAISEK